MSPADIRDDAIDEIGVMGYSAPTDDALREGYATAGATWWLESLHDRRAPYAELLARVQAGPQQR
jgi:hypothetical protein